MTPEDFKDIRTEACLSFNQLGAILRVHPRTVRRYEKGTIPISGPVSVIMELIDMGRPAAITGRPKINWVYVSATLPLPLIDQEES